MEINLGVIVQTGHNDWKDNDLMTFVPLSCITSIRTFQQVSDCVFMNHYEV
jgi:hypothetical protein